MKILLRPVTLEDGNIIVRWRNSNMVISHCFDKTPITIDSNRIFYNSFIETGKYKQFIVERIDEDYGVASYPIATVYLKDFDIYNHRCELCIFTSDDQEWNTESQSIAIKKLLDKAFYEYNIHKIYSYVFAENKDEVDLLERSGFKKEAILKQEAYNIYGDYVDVFRMAFFFDNYILQKDR